MMSDFLNFISLILISFESDLSSMSFRIACDFASILLNISSCRSSLSLSATRESTSTKISFTKCIAFNSFSCSTLSSTELFSSGWINSGYFVKRWVTNRMHSGIPFFFSSGFCRQCLYHSANDWSSVMYHLKVFKAERWFEQNSPVKMQKIRKVSLIKYKTAESHKNSLHKIDSISICNPTLNFSFQRKREDWIEQVRQPKIKTNARAQKNKTHRKHFSVSVMTAPKRTQPKCRQCCR